MGRPITAQEEAEVNAEMKICESVDLKTLARISLNARGAAIKSRAVPEPGKEAEYDLTMEMYGIAAVLNVLHEGEERGETETDGVVGTGRVKRKNFKL